MKWSNVRFSHRHESLEMVTGHIGIKSLRNQTISVPVPNQYWCRTGPDTSDPVPKCPENNQLHWKNILVHRATTVTPSTIHLISAVAIIIFQMRCDFALKNRDCDAIICRRTYWHVSLQQGWLDRCSLWCQTSLCSSTEMWRATTGNKLHCFNSHW